jgi:hypothetical protein
MSLFDGLYSYEVVLLILAGSLLLTRLLPALLFDVKATGPLYLSVRGSVPGRVARHHLDPVTALRQHWRGARTHACRVPTLGDARWVRDIKVEKKTPQPDFSRCGCQYRRFWTARRGCV